jgi:hypothetical protein
MRCWSLRFTASGVLKAPLAICRRSGHGGAVHPDGVDGADPAATLSGDATTLYLALWDCGEEIVAALTDRRARPGAGDPVRSSGVGQQASASTRGEVDNGTAPAGVISTCSSSLTPSRPPTAPMKLSTHSTMPSSIIPS